MSLLNHLGDQFLNSDYYQRALTHRSVSAVNNERLEYLGDSLLGFIIAEWLFENFPEYSEGDLTKLRAHLVKKDTLAEIAREHNLGDLIILGAGELKSGGIHRSSILADALEAIIGALYLFEGIETARDFVLKLFQSRLQNIPTIEQLKDSKTKLQEHLQSRGLALPVYSLQSRIGKSGDEIFTIECVVEECEETFIGSGKSRRKAEQEAAERAFVYLSKYQSS